MMRNDLFSRGWPRAFGALGAVALAAGLIVACGGSDDAPAPAGPAASSIEGVAAVGAALSGARVEFQCVAGSPAAQTTAAGGSFTVPAGSTTFPCIAVATGGTVGGSPNGDTLYAAITGAGTANVTSLTTLQLAYLVNKDLAAWLADVRGTPASLAAAITPAKLATALATLKAQLATLPTPVTLPSGFDPVTTVFAANSADAFDQLLDQLKASLAAGGATLKDAQTQASAALALVERTPASVTMEKIGGYAHAGGLSSAEITAYDPLSKRLFTINGALGTADVLNLANPTAPVQVGTVTTAVFGAGLGGVNSVAIHSGVVALAIEASPKTNNGIVALLRASDLHVLGTATVGALPDMLAFSPDGKYLLVANEGEPSNYNVEGAVDPEGSVSVIALSALSPTASSVSMTVTSVGFSGFNGQIEEMRAAGVRIFGPNATVAQDLEPEYITVSADSKKAYVTLQENNAIAVIDIASKSVLSIKPLGLKDNSIAGNGLDISNEDGGTSTNSGTPTIKIQTYPIKSMYLPDGIASFTVGTATYLITANEGDTREYSGINSFGREDPRVREYCTAGLDTTVFGGNTNTFTFDSAFGRLRMAAMPNAGRNAKNEAGQCNEIIAFGGRSFSIWNSDVALVFDSGDQFEQKTAAMHPGLTFNASNDNNTFEDRSPAKGPEPEGVTVGKIGTKTFAFIGLERVGGVMVYDVSNPAAPVYVTYLNTRSGAGGDNGPEGLHFVRAAHSPNGKPLLIVGNETSGTTAIYQLNLSY
jgi:DNA-binding beta-propeller fold protein YncE